MESQPSNAEPSPPESVAAAIDTVARARRERAEARHVRQLGERSADARLDEALHALAERESELEAAIQARKTALEPVAQENAFLSQQLERTSARYTKLMSEYDALYRYCEQFLKDANQRNAVLNQEAERLRALASEEQRAKDRNSVELEQAKGALAKLHEEVQRHLRGEERRTGAMKAAEARLTTAREGLSRTRRNMAELERSLCKFVESTAAQGPGAIALRASKIFLEQLRMELEGMQGLDGVLNEATMHILKALENSKS